MRSVTAIFWTACVLAAGSPTASQEGDFWRRHGQVYSTPVMDPNGKLCLYQTLFCRVTEEPTPELPANPAQPMDAHGNPVPHVHFRDEFVDIDAANRYWDAKLDAPNSCQRITNATIRSNEISRVLTLAGAGKFDCWIDDQAQVMRLMQSIAPNITPVLDAGGAQAERPNQATRRQNLVRGLKWKTGPSGVYEAVPFYADSTHSSEVIISK